MRFVVSFILILSCFCDPSIRKITKKLLWTREEAPTRYAHVCTISELPNGDIIVAYQAGSGERKKDCTIWRSIRKNGVWGDSEKALHFEDCSMNPSLYQNDDGKLFLMYHRGGGLLEGECSPSYWKGYFSVSLDQGKSFVNPTELPSGFLGSVKNQCLKMTNGEVICPSSTQTIDEILPIWESHFEITNDEFSNWKYRSNNIRFNFGKWPCQGIIQPTIYEDGIIPGKIIAYFRSGCGVIAKATSHDYGRNWPEHAEETNLPNPNSGIDLVKNRGEDNTIILTFNNSTSHRTPLSLSYNDSKGTWKMLVDLETDKNGQFAYPFIIQSNLDPKKSYVCYTHKLGYDTIAFVEIEWE